MESNVYPWQHACKKTGATLHVISNTRDNWTVSVLEALDSHPPELIAVVALSMVHWCSGEAVAVQGAATSYSPRARSNALLMSFFIA